MDCLACGPTTSSASNEHVFANWMLKEFEPDASMPLYRQFELLGRAALDGCAEHRERGVILALQHGSKHRMGVAHRPRLYIEAAFRRRLWLQSRFAIIFSSQTDRGGDRLSPAIEGGEPRRLFPFCGARP